MMGGICAYNTMQSQIPLKQVAVLSDIPTPETMTPPEKTKSQLTGETVARFSKGRYDK